MSCTGRWPERSGHIATGIAWTAGLARWHTCAVCGRIGVHVSRDLVSRACGHHDDGDNHNLRPHQVRRPAGALGDCLQPRQVAQGFGCQRGGPREEMTVSEPRSPDDCACHNCDSRIVGVAVDNITFTPDGRRVVHSSCPRCGDSWDWWLPDNTASAGTGSAGRGEPL